MKRTIIIVLTLLLVLIAGCRDADVVSRNISKDADQFKVRRRVIFYNAITDQIMFEMVGNLSIETTRAEIQNQNAPQKVNAEGEAPKIGIVNFVIKTAYTPSKAAGSSANAPTTASVPGAAQTQPVQVAKN